MTILIFIFAGLMILAGAVLLVNPHSIFGLLRQYIDSLAIHVIAVLARLIVGAIFVAQSSVSKFPPAIEILGWIFIVAGISLAVIGRHRFRTLVSWVLTKFSSIGRLAGAIAMAFGGFIVFAFL